MPRQFTYAGTTVVPVEKSIHEMEWRVARYGGTNFTHQHNYGGHAYIGFELYGERIRIYIPLPDPGSAAFLYTTTGRARTPAKATDAYEQAVRQIYRDLVLTVVQQLEKIEANITFVDPVTATRRAFVSDLVLDDGSAQGTTWREVADKAVGPGGVMDKHVSGLLPAPDDWPVTLEKGG